MSYIKKIPTPPTNPKRPKTPYELFVQQAGLTFGVLFLLMGIGNMYFLMSPLYTLSEFAQVILILSELILVIFGAVLIAIFSD